MLSASAKAFVFLIILSSVAQAANDSYTFFNPGIKIGYTFGQNGGFTYGIEISVVVFSHKVLEPRSGFVFDYDRVGGMNRLHFGVEYMFAVFGADFGPTVGWKDNVRMVGFSITPFAGALILPYYSFTYFNEQTLQHEVGSYFKGFVEVGGTHYAASNDD